MDERLTEEQIQAEQERLNAIRDGTAGQAELNKELDLMKSALAATAKVAKEYTKSMADGQHGAKQFKGAIDLAGSAADKAVAGLMGLAFMLAPLTAGMSLLILGVGAAASGAVKLGKEWAKASTDQADALYKTYQDLNKIGAAGSAGMTGIFRDMQNFGYNVQELDKMIALVAENSKTLAQLGGIASVGTKRFAQLSNEVRDSDVGRKLLYAGNTVDDLNQAEVTYLKTITLIGNQRAKTDKELAAGSAALADNFDLLRRVTGETLADQARKTVAMYQEDAYGQITEDLNEMGESGKAVSATLDSVMRQLPDKVREMMARSVGGRIGSPEDAKIFAAIPGFYQAFTAMARTGVQTYTQEQLLEIYNEEIKTRKEAVKGLFRLNAGRNVFNLTREDMIKSYAPGTPGERLAQAKQDQQLGDQQTKTMTELNLTQMDATRALDSLINAGINPTITALQKLAEVATDLYEAPGKMAPSLFGPAGGSRLRPTGGPTSRETAYGSYVKDLFGVKGPSQYKPAAGGKGDWVNDKGFMDAVDAFAKKKKINANDLLAVMGVETGGTMSPSAKNPGSTASGLIQFMESTAKDLGTTTAELRKMNREDQMKYVEKYFDMVGLRAGADIGEIYQKVFMPNKDPNMLAKRGTKEYAQNYQLDVNNDGVITRDDLREIARQRGVQMGLGMDLKPGGTGAQPAGAATAAVPKPEEKKPAPAAPTQVYKPALPATKPEEIVKTEKTLSTPKEASVEVQQQTNEEMFKLMQRQTNTFESMLALQRKTAENTGKIAKSTA